MSLTLYYHPLSSYCHKALIALYELSTAFETRFINLGDEHDRAVLSALWPICKFPVLIDATHSRVIPEASLIVEYADHLRARAKPLIPHDFDSALEVRKWDRIFDNYVQTPLQEIVIAKMSGDARDLSAAYAR
ncbi:MAG TPA: glutathione S-transferase family protein, partial [Pseudomonadales bacterium]|nr:glutathione S-transferase family protein [Pseudomonadales bacterium]